MLEVDPPWDEILPEGGVVRGQVVACSGVAAISAALSLAAGVTRRGGWVAVVEHPERFRLGIAAAAETGVVLDRTVLVTPTVTSSRTPPGLVEAVAALVEGFEVVILAGRWSLPEPAQRRLQARLRTRGGVVICVDGSDRWQVDLHVRTRPAVSHLAAAHELVGHEVAGWQDSSPQGRLVRRRITVEIEGRRHPRPHRVDLWLPGSGSHRTGTRIADGDDGLGPTAIAVDLFDPWSPVTSEIGATSEIGRDRAG